MEAPCAPHAEGADVRQYFGAARPSHIDPIAPRKLVVSVGVFAHLDNVHGDVGLYRVRLPDLAQGSR